LGDADEARREMFRRVKEARAIGFRAVAKSAPRRRGADARAVARANLEDLKALLSVPLRSDPGRCAVFVAGLAAEKLTRSSKMPQKCPP
jgi:hypothetical protein